MRSVSNNDVANDFDLEHFLPYRMSLLSNTLSQGIAQFYQQRYQLSVPEWRVMVILGRYPGLTASQVCERTVMDKVTVSRAVKSLLDKQYVERVTDQNDRRKRPLKIRTPEGSKVMEEVIPFAVEYQNALQKSLTKGEWGIFDELMERLLSLATRLNQEFASESELKTSVKSG